MFLQLHNADIGYSKPLINKVNATAELGKLCLLIGNNGTGKTTLLRTLLHQIPTLSGQIILEGKNIATLNTREIAEQITVVFSKAPHLPDYSLWDLVALGKYIHYLYYFELNYEDKREVANIIEQLNLTEYRDLPLSKLSDGNLQKAFIGRALAQNSPFIILDEPTTHLDEENKIMILHLLKNLAEEHKKLVLFSSHDWRLARFFASDVWYLKNKTLHIGKTEEIFAEHSELSSPPRI